MRPMNSTSPVLMPVTVRSTTTLLLLMGLAMTSGCVQQPEGATEPPKVPVASPLAQSGPTSETATSGRMLTEPQEKKFEGVTVTIPAGWEERPVASEFIQAEYRAPGSAGPARVTFSSAGGGREANLERWEGQFQRGPDDAAPVRDRLTIDGAEADFIEVHGTFNDAMGGQGQQQNWCLLGAVIPQGPANFFIKLTGPRDTAREHREAFLQLVRSVRLTR